MPSKSRSLAVPSALAPYVPESMIIDYAFLGHAQRTTAMGRFAGYQQAMRSAGIPVDLNDPLVITVGNVSSQIMPAAGRIENRYRTFLMKNTQMAAELSTMKPIGNRPA